MSLASGEGVVLRRLREDDLVPFLAYRRDPDVARYQSWEAMDEAAALRFLAAMASVEPLLRPGDWTQVAIADPVSDALLGDMGLYLDETGEEAELGVTLALAAQGAGRGSAALRLGAELIFAESSAVRIWGISDLRNGASLGALWNAGFVTDRDEETDGLMERFTFLDRPA